MSDFHSYREKPFLFCILGLSIGVFFTIAGGYLLNLGGSAFYVCIGPVYVVISFLAWRGRRAADRLYALSLAATLAWSLYEAGLAPWGLLPRLLIPVVGGVWISMPWIRRQLAPRSGVAASAIVAALCLVVLVGAYLHPLGTPADPHFPGIIDKSASSDDWRHYGNGPDGTRYSPLDQITKANVRDLKVAWVFRSGDAFDPPQATESTPLMVGGTLYTCTSHDTVIALDAQSGAEKWRYDAKIGALAYPMKICRGVSYFAASDSLADCPARVFLGTIDHRLIALDAATGSPCASFGKQGIIDLNEGFGEVPAGQIGVSSPPTIVGRHVIVGSLIADNHAADMPSGTVQSFDAVTGQLQWAWDMGVPERIGAPAAGETYTRSTANAWSVFSVDEKLGLVYLPTGNPSPDSWAVNRRSFDEKYGSSVVALDIETGRPRWSFQTVHHDLWDYDVPAQPTLTEFPTPDGPVPALIQATKRGDIFILDRRTGKPLVPVVERDVSGASAPGKGLPENWLSPTQPFSALAVPIAEVSEKTMWGATAIDQLLCRIQFHQSRYGGRFTPPGTDWIIEMPGLTGGVNWGALSLDRDRGVLISNYMNLPWRGRLIPKTELTPDYVSSHFAGMMHGTPYSWTFQPWKGAFDVPCQQPPWGNLIAFDLAGLRVLWDHPIGTGEDFGPFGVATHLPLTIGVPSLSGTVTTRGGLIFISGTADQYIRAFDEATGAELWKARLPAGGQATPMTYMVKGRQYLVVTAGGNSLMGSKFGDYTIAYALPQAP